MTDITYMDCWHYIAPLIPVKVDTYSMDVYVMIFQALKEAEKRKVKENDGDETEVHGRWIHTDLASHWYGKDECSECTYHEHDRSDLSHFRYCPNCGAKMDGGVDDAAD